MCGGEGRDGWKGRKGSEALEGFQVHVTQKPSLPDVGAWVAGVARPPDLPLPTVAVPFDTSRDAPGSLEGLPPLILPASRGAAPPPPHCLGHQLVPGQRVRNYLRGRLHAGKCPSPSSPIERSFFEEGYRSMYCTGVSRK